MRNVRIPAGDHGVTIDASPQKPKEITPGYHVHLTFEGIRNGQLSTQEGLSAGQTQVIYSPCHVKTTDGTPTTVRVKSAPRGRSHAYPADAA